MALAAMQLFRDRLGKIARLLEAGDAEAAAAIMETIQELYPQLPGDMPADELMEARRLLERCAVLEAELRQRVVASLNDLGARRRGLVYRHLGSRP